VKILRAFPLIFAIGLEGTIRKKRISLKETENNFKKLSTISWGSAPDPELFCPFPIEDQRFLPQGMTLHLPARAKRAILEKEDAFYL